MTQTKNVMGHVRTCSGTNTKEGKSVFFLAALWNYGLSEDHPYRNKLATIRKGTIIHKKKNLK